jgi:hypothetical protein
LFKMSQFFDVEFFPSTKGIHPQARYRLNADKCLTFCLAKKGRKENETLYSYIQCKKVDGMSKGNKNLRLHGTAVLNGDPTVCHKEGCMPLKMCIAHPEVLKRKGSKEVGDGTSSVANARLNNLEKMIASCADIGVDENECRKNWNSKAISSRYNKRKSSRLPPLSITGQLPEVLEVCGWEVGGGRGDNRYPAL